MPFENLLYARDGAVVRITINRPDRRNALSPQTVMELRDALNAAKLDRDARVVVLTGAGTIFCAGADLTSFRSEQPGSDADDERWRIGDLFLEMTQLGKPTIARVNGHALAGGFGLVAACDLAIATDDAQFGLPEINVGLFPMIIMAVLSRNLPRKALMELMLTGRRIDAAEAARLGLINRYVAADRLDPVVDSLAADLARRAPMAMRLGLDAFYRMQDMSFPAAIAYLQNQLALLSKTDDVKEGVAAFFEKREPRFRGR